MSNGRIFIGEDKTLVMLINKNAAELSCNGSLMKVLTANTTDAAQEKHVPVVEVDGNKISVKVGSVAHPMTDAHLIEWIYLQTKKGGQHRYLTAADKPEATFLLRKMINLWQFTNIAICTDFGKRQLCKRRLFNFVNSR